MAQTALFMAPMARKKHVEEKYSPNTYRVISYDAESLQDATPNPKTKITNTSTDEVNLLGQSGEFIPLSEHRYNRPNPRNVGFLRQDVRLLNEPVCDVHTKCTALEQDAWWPHRTSKEPQKVPDHTLDTTVREDFQYRGTEIAGNNRHSSNPNKEPALGSVPVNFMRKNGSQRVWKEGMSYEHQYNCRSDPSYPIRAKRHGSFVWDQFPQSEVDKMLQYFGPSSNSTGDFIVKDAPSSSSGRQHTNSNVFPDTTCQKRKRASKESSIPVLPPIAM